MLLNACSPPRPAPVVSREVGHQHKFAAKSGFYRVRRGDTIYSIAWRFGLDHRKFARWNNIKFPYRIYPGRSLRVASPPGRSVVRNNRVQPATQSKARVVSIKRTTTRKNFNTALKLHWQWPTKGKVRVRFKRGNQSRKGVVLSGRLGQGIRAAEAGTVVYSGSGLIGYGKLLIIKHNKNYLSAYGHNKKLLVKEGDQVKKGSRIAEMGTNGRGNIVLHFEIRRNGVPVDPLSLLPRKS